MSVIGQSVSRFRMDAKISYTILCTLYEMFSDKPSIKFSVDRNKILKLFPICIKKMIT